jgi:hypothetical protein
MNTQQKYKTGINYYRVNSGNRLTFSRKYEDVVAFELCILDSVGQEKYKVFEKECGGKLHEKWESVKKVLIYKHYDDTGMPQKTTIETRNDAFFFLLKISNDRNMILYTIELTYNEKTLLHTSNFFFDKSLLSTNENIWMDIKKSGECKETSLDSLFERNSPRNPPLRWGVLDFEDDEADEADEDDDEDDEDDEGDDEDEAEDDEDAEDAEDAEEADEDDDEDEDEDDNEDGAENKQISAEKDDILNNGDLEITNI